MSAITVNGMELNIDVLDADEMERLFNTVEKTRNAITALQSDPEFQKMSIPNQMRQQCRIIDGHFDALFGEGTAAACFPKSGDLRTRLDAFGQTCAIVQESAQETQDIIDKYSPQRANREQRRSNVKSMQGHKGKNNSFRPRNS